MAKSLPASFLSSIEQAHGPGFVWLLEIELDRGSDTVPPVLLRICDQEQPVTWPVSDPEARVWHPFPFQFTPVEQTEAGELTSIDLSVDNTARLLMRWLHDGNGLEGNRVDVYLVARNGLAIAHPNHEYEQIELEIAGAAASYDAVTFRLSRPNWFSIMSPTDRYVPKRCRWTFGSSECGYPINEFAAYTRCPKTIEACTERGDDMVARGLPRLLPDNYGGHPGISTQR